MSTFYKNDFMGCRHSIKFSFQCNIYIYIYIYTGVVKPWNVIYNWPYGISFYEYCLPHLVLRALYDIRSQLGSIAVQRGSARCLAWAAEILESFIHTSWGSPFSSSKVILCASRVLVPICSIFVSRVFYLAGKLHRERLLSVLSVV